MGNSFTKKFKKKLYSQKFIKRILRKIVYFIFPNNLRYFIFKEFLNEEVNTLNKSKSDLIIFPSQNITSYQVNKKSLSTIHDLMHRYESKFSEYSNNVIIQRDLHYQNICNFCDGILVDPLWVKIMLLIHIKSKKKVIYSTFYCSKIFN